MQQFRLQLKWNFPDLIEKQRSVVRQFKTASPLRNRAGERAFFMTEKFAFQQAQRNRSAIQFYKRMSRGES